MILLAFLLAAASGQYRLPPMARPSACRATDGYATAFGGRRTFLLNPDQLQAIKAVRDRDPVVRQAYVALLARANAALARKPSSVMDKTRLPPSATGTIISASPPIGGPIRPTPTGPIYAVTAR